MNESHLMQLGNFIDVFLARHVSGTYAHHQEHYMLSCSIWFSAPSLWMGGAFESCCIARVYSTICTVNTIYAATLKTTTHPKTRCRKPYAATQHLMLLMMGVPETCRAKNTSIKLPNCIKLAFHFISQ